MWPVNLGQLGLGDELLLLVFSLLQLEKQPMTHLLSIRFDGTSRGGEIRLIKWDDADLAVLFLVGKSKICSVLRETHRRITAHHFKRYEQALLDKLFPRRATDHFDEIACERIHQVVVLPLAA